MYFIYEKPMHIATEYNYDVSLIVNWFAELDLTELWEDLSKTDWLNPAQIANDVLTNTNWWSQDFRDWCLFSEAENEYITDQDLYEQLSDVVEPHLAKYYKDHWEDLTEAYTSKDV